MSKLNDNLRVSALLGRWYRRSGNWGKAALYFQQAAEARPEDGPRWESLARALEFGGLSGAMEAYGKSADLGSMTADSWYRYGRLLEQSGKCDEAAQAYHRAEANGRDAGHMAFRRGRSLSGLGESMAAAVEYRRAIEEGFDPQASFLALEGLFDANTPSWVKLDLYREGQSSFGGGKAWTASHARLAAEMKFYAEAVDCFKLVREHRTLSPSEAVTFAESLEFNDEHAQARQVLEHAVSTGSAHDIALGAGVLFQKLGKWSRARQEYLNTGASIGTSAELAARIALTYDREYRWTEASEGFERAFRLDPSDAQAAYKCGHAHERGGRPEAAAGWYREALALRPAKLHWWYRLGMALNQSGDQAGSLYALRRSLKLADSIDPQTYPQHRVGQGSPNVRHLDQASKARKVAWVEQACSGGPWTIQRAAGLVEIAILAMSLGLRDQASFLATSASMFSVELDPKTRLDLSVVLERLERVDDAVETLLDSRTVRTPDGVDLKIYLPAGSDRAPRQYAEFVSAIPVSASVVLFESNHGAGAACHPLALYREMVADPRFSGARFVWALKNPQAAPRELVEDPRVAIVALGSDTYLYHLATAGFLINNVSFPPYFVRRAEQRYLNTWHGTPMKTLGRSMKQGLVEYENLERNFLQASHLMAPNELTKWAILEEHHLDGIYPGSVQILGSPRLDALVRNTADIRMRIRARLGLEDDDRVVLIAPTWRGGVSTHGLDADSLIEQLTAVAAIPGIQVFYRAHRLTEKLVAGLDLPVRVVPQEIDTNDLLAAVDHLVSDYSSIVFDFLVTGKPITLFVPDLQDYRETRGLYREPQELPVGVANTVQDLVDDIRAGGEVPAEHYADAVAEYCPQEDGYAAARALDFLLSDVHKGAELNGKQTVLFHASMIPNGIASALLAILEELVQQDLNVLLIVEPSVLRRAEDRAGIFSKLPKGVRLVSRVGGTTMTPEEFYVRGVVERRCAMPGADMMQTYKDSWRLEASRIAGDIPLTAAIEWDGYATLWAGIMANVGQDSTRKLIWQHNEMEEEESHKYPGLGAVFAMYPWFDAAVSVSTLLADKNRSFVDERGVSPREGTAAVRNTLSFDQISARALEPLPDDLANRLSQASHTVVTVGRMSMEKNHLALVEAWPSVLAEFPESKLAIVGSGPLEAHVVSLVQKLGLEDAIILTGQVMNPYPIIAAADLFVLPSLHEGQPIVLFEAMQLGVGIAASGCPGNVEALGAGYGYTLGTDVEGIGDGIRGCLRSPAVAQGDFRGAHHRDGSVLEFSKVVFAAK